MTPLDAIGKTPLFKLQRLTQNLRPTVSIWAKAEWLNPAGSVKDRPAAGMFRKALESGELKPGKIILDATSGNTGIALSMLAASFGYPIELCLPSNASPERKNILTAYGAKLILTDPLQGSDGAILKARELFKDNPEKYLYMDQYNNDANWKAHYETTGPEIWEQTKGRVTHFIAGLGTSGTVMGVGKRLKQYDSSVSVIAMQPDSPFHGLEGLKHMQSAIVPGIYDASVPDRQVTVTTEEAHEWTIRLAREEGMFVGISSGANFAAALKLGLEMEEGLIVTMFCDSGDKYMSETFWEKS